MKKISLFITFAVISILGMAQSAELNLISTTGGVFTNNNLSLSFTVGEVVTESFSTNDLFLTQGFLQNTEYTTNIKPEEYQSFSIIAYPNPATQFIFIDIDMGDIIYSGYVQATLLNINGKTLKHLELNKKITQLDVSDYPSGTYFLRFDNQNKTIVFQKINY